MKKNKPQPKNFVRYYIETWENWSDAWFIHDNKNFSKGRIDTIGEAILKVKQISNTKKCRIVKEEIRRTIVEEYGTSTT